MRYLIIPKIGTPFFTNWYQYENNWSDDYLMISTEANIQLTVKLGKI